MRWYLIFENIGEFWVCSERLLCSEFMEREYCLLGGIMLHTVVYGDQGS